MRSTEQEPATAARRRWMSALSQAEPAELEQAWRQAGSPEAARWVRPPETGLVMVRGRAGGAGAPFNLGEMTATRCAVQIEGSDVIGYAMTAGRDQRKAELAALLDAVFQAGAEDLAAGVVDTLSHARAERNRAEAAKAAATRVDFFTLVRGD
jgi:alpha-D-ribose 1-methylphosphonate 5-triphosphate synthase subunit PhnG